MPFKLFEFLERFMIDDFSTQLERFMINPTWENWINR